MIYGILNWLNSICHEKEIFWNEIRKVGQGKGSFHFRESRWLFSPVGILSELIRKDRLNPQEKLEFERLSQEYEKEELRLHLADVQDARKSNVDIQQAAHASPLAKNTAYILDFVIVVSTILIGLLLFFQVVPGENQQIASIVFGALLAHCGTVVGFHRGTSKEKEILVNN